MNIEDHRSRTFLCNDEGKYLFMLRIRQNGDRAILLPGGGVDEGETIEDANMRELHEELGITIHNAKEIYTFFDLRANPALRPGDEGYGIRVPTYFHFFTAEWSGDMKICETDKFESLHWIYLRDLHALADSLGARISDGVITAIRFLPR